MDKRRTLEKLQELLSKAELEDGFPDKESRLRWAVEVKPLLNFNLFSYGADFSFKLQRLQLNIDENKARLLVKEMKTIVKMAVEQLRNELKSEIPLVPEGLMLEWDVFICHASEDKKTVVEPLANELVKRGLKVWYDKYVLRIGDSLLQKIDEGLSKSKYGIVILSPSFFMKDWPKKELDGLIQKEIGGEKVILPVWHNIKRNDIIKYSPTLAGRLAGTTEKGISSLSKELLLAIKDSISKENTIITPSTNVDVSVSYKRISIDRYLHRYSLMFAIHLNSPPTKKGFKLKLLWPEFIKISNFSGIVLNKGKLTKIDKIEYREYWYSYETKLYPGDTIELIWPDGRTILEYEFDHNIWDVVEEKKVSLFWEIYFSDQMPVKGNMSFQKLNIY